MGSTGERYCIACNIAPRVGRKYCRQCGTTRRAQQRRTNIHREFVGIDGEGVDRPDGTHDYVMLSVGEETLTNAGKLLPLQSILEFLWHCHTEVYPAAEFIGFSLGYDFGQWLRQLPEERAQLLYNPEVRRSHQGVTSAVVWEGWEIDLLANKRFSLKPHIHKRGIRGECTNKTCRVRVGGDTPRKVVSPMYICDTFSYWQCSFEKAIDPAQWAGEPPSTEAERRIISEGKADRGHVYDYGETSYLAEMERYNKLENAVLARITERLRQGFENDIVPLKIGRGRWYGPGTAAETWMGLVDEKLVGGKRRTTPGEAHINLGGVLGADTREAMPTWFQKAAQASYYGGWFEIPIHGHAGTLYEYDINSAYPFVISTLPCLHTHGRHTGSYTRGRGNSYPSMGYTILYCTVRGSNRYFGPMPYRDTKGRVSRPEHVKGWYWAHEIDASRRAGLIDSVDVHEWYHYKPCHCPPPFAMDDIGIGRLYTLRLEVGKNTAQGKSFKLAYNSAYGKNCQSVGTPRYANPAYASLITSGCRTAILQSIASHPRGAASVAMVATDGIYFTSPHPSLPISKTTLGAWDVTEKTGMTLFMPGVYWDDKGREKLAAGEIPAMKSRGVNPRYLAASIERIDAQFTAMTEDIESYWDSGGAWPTVKLNLKLQITSPKLALHRGKWETAGQLLHNVPRTISANPISKRYPIPYMDGPYLRTEPYRCLDGAWPTVPYDRSFGAIYDDATLEDSVGFDGDTLGGTLAEVLR